mmetsp:Transcript_12074/g.19917  ORF Transcript_12074/g.19917 Transcript_12074/m.19917 type:complete len:107 (-) Transcript_12074:237-557(-)
MKTTSILIVLTSTTDTHCVCSVEKLYAYHRWSLLCHDDCGSRILHIEEPRTLERSRNREKEHAFLGEELGEYKQVEVSSMRKSKNNYAKWPKTTSCCGQAWAKETV